MKPWRKTLLYDENICMQAYMYSISVPVIIASTLSPPVSQHSGEILGRQLQLYYTYPRIYVMNFDNPLLFNWRKSTVKT
jgi:hypothetical protein